MPTLNTPISRIPGIAPVRAKALEKLGIRTVRDLLFHFPFRYEDYSLRTPIADLQAGQMATVMGEVAKSEALRTWKKRMRLTTATIADETASVRAVWFNQPYLAEQLKVGMGVRFSGKVSADKSGLFFSNPSWERSSREPTNTGRLVPVYGETEGITSRFFRWKMQSFIEYARDLEDPLPEWILKELHLPDIATALGYIHFPATQKHAILAQKRFAFQQMLQIQLISLRLRQSWDKEKAPPIKMDEDLLRAFIGKLPFIPTGAQKKAVYQICKDLEKTHPMNRLLNGDVGSGKTLVAAMGLLGVAKNGYQATLMAPTEVLARQHFESISKLLARENISVGLLTNAYQLSCDRQSSVAGRPQIKTAGGLPVTDDKNFYPQKLSKKQLLEEIKNGKIDVVIGTHALLQEAVKFKNLALVVVDEQHRFGVSQRAYLQQKIESLNDGLPGKIPHLLSMTATPIPRTLSLAFMGNLDISLLDEMPKNRKSVITQVITPGKRQSAYDFIRQQIRDGRQAFVVLPLVEESEKLGELKAAISEHARLSEDIFPEFSLGLLHGRMKAAEKEDVMRDFKEKKHHLLVATSVVEVGIDVPNATIIMIEDADRFGLAQLHQFRGRVGRGEQQSYCFLLSSSSGQKATARLKIMRDHRDGFAIAEKDLELRGPGDFLGQRQSGLADSVMQQLGNVRLIEAARRSAQALLEDDPTLSSHPPLKKELEEMEQKIHLE